MKDIIIAGAGDLGKDVAWLIERINEVTPTWNILGFTEITDDKEFQGYPILGNDEVISKYSDVYVACAVANTKVRRKIIDSISKTANIATLIDPNAMIHPSAKIGEGSMIFANTLVGVDANIGKQCILLYGGKVNHDCNIGDYVTIYPNATISGKCNIGNNCEVGTGSSMIQGTNICDDAIIGVGAAIFTSVKKPGTTYGNPAVTMGVKNDK